MVEGMRLTDPAIDGLERCMAMQVVEWFCVLTR
jgi:hypothetical protein